MKIKEMIIVGIFAALTSVGAFIIIPLPFSPVPITLQLLFVFLAGGLLGKKLGLLSQLIYVMIGTIGIPVFAGGMGGIGALFGPTAGYIYGFLFAAYISGLGRKSFWSKITVYTAALSVIYLSGILGLMLTTGIGFVKALTVGIIPFIAGDLLKIAAAAYLTSKIPTDILE